MLYKKFFFFLVLALVASRTSSAQETGSWSLERCIDYAQKNSINIKQSQINVRNSEIAIAQNKAARLPDLNGNFNFNLNGGSSVNFNTYQLTNNIFGFNNVGLSSGVLLYNAGKITKSIAQSKIDNEAAQADLEQTTQAVALNVASAYLQVLLAMEQLENAKKRTTQTKEQLDQLLKSIKAGARPNNDRYDLDAQLAKNEQFVVTQQNTLDIAYLSIKQLLLLDPDTDFKVVRPNNQLAISDNLDGLSLKSIFLAAYNQQPQIRAGELRLKSKEIGVDIAKADFLPSITANVSLGSRFATNDKDIIPGTEKPILSPPIPIVFNGTSTSYQQVFIDGDRKTVPYFKQLGSNFNYGAGIGISIPIYNNGRTKAAVERAHLDVMNTQLQNQQTQQQLKTDIQRALADARAGKKQLEAAEKTLKAYKIAADNADKKLKVGASTIFEYTTAVNNVDTAERDVTVAKYDYLFKLKILDYYQGKTMDSL